MNNSRQWPLPKNISQGVASPYASQFSAGQGTSVGRSMASLNMMMTTTMEYGMNARKRQLGEDEALEEDDDLEYIPAPGSPSASGGNNADDDDGEDPLDSFMANIEVQARKDKETSQKHEKEVSEPNKSGSSTKLKLGRTDIEDEDDQESYFKWVEENADKIAAQNGEDEEEDLEYDEEGNPLPPRKKFIDPLPPVDHSIIDYKPFERNFYIEHEQISSLTEPQVAELRKKLDVKVSGLRPSKPVSSFAHFGFDEQLMGAVRKSEYSQPTPIQSQAIPVALNGRDIIGIAKTGSGKTAAYLWPALIHIVDQPQLEEGDGPICLIVVPTRELAIQVYSEAKRFGKVYSINVVCAYGGGSKWEQSKDLQDGAEIVVCTPGRLIDLVKIKATNLKRVTFLVFDEADKMFDLGFEAQVRSIANHVRPDRQCLMFSATFKKKIERLARDMLNDPIKIIQGELGEANEDIQQIVEVFKTAPSKWIWLTERLVQFCSLGKVLIFVSQKLHVEEVAKNLKSKDFKAGLLHGDVFQHERNDIITAFRKQDMPILVATDVAARGLDIPSIKTVINYDAPKDIDTYIHRIGRTGRAGEKGTAYTLLVTDKDKDFAGYLVRNLESVNQDVSPTLMELAMQSAQFRKSRFREGKAKKPGVGGRGLGFKGDSKSFAKSSSLSGFNATPSGIKETIQNQTKFGADRLSAMKSAFSSTYKSAFHSASAETSWSSQECAYTDPTPEWKKRPVEKETEKSSEFKIPESLPKFRSKDEESRKRSHEERSDSSKNSEKNERRKKSRWN